jgi:REP element-mobilizing transposase RayT
MASEEFNTSGIPIAYLITFRCYGTWLHGDNRGSTDRFHNGYGTPFIQANQIWEQHNRRSLRSTPVTLNSEQRAIVDASIRETCQLLRWVLYCLNVRTNHVHSVVASSAKPERILSTLKADSTKMMRTSGCWTLKHPPWSERGSKRYLWTEQSLERAIDYVLNGQGGPLPDFNEE